MFDRAPNIHDIARVAKVSKTTVSRVINGSPDVAPRTRLRVLEVIEQLGYQVNSAARTLRTSRSALVGLLVPGLHEVFAEIAQELDRELSTNGIGMLMTISEWDTKGDLRGLESLRSRGVDAVVASLANDQADQVREYLSAYDRPLVLLDRQVPGVNCDAVLTDQHVGVTGAVEHLFTLGHRSIGLAAMSDDTRPGRETVAAYTSACEGVGVPPRPELIYRSDNFDRAAGRTATNHLLAAGATGILALGPMALVAGVLERLEELQLNVPGDVSVIGYDENELAFVKPPRLTVIGRRVSEFGRRAGRLAMSRIESPRLDQRLEVLETSLVMHESSGPVRDIAHDVRASDRDMVAAGS